jgi:hypothetical protein
MKITNPFAFDVNEATIKLSELFTTHGTCPSTNNMTWKPFKAGKSIYQFWTVTPNKLGLIKSKTPTITLDGVNYIATPIYLLSLNNHVKFYTSDPLLNIGRDLNCTLFTGYVNDFVNVSISSADFDYMTGIFLNGPSGAAYSKDSIKTWVENGNIWLEAYAYGNVPGSISRSSISLSVGNSVRCVVNEPELSPIYNIPVSVKTGISNVEVVSSVTPPSGWSWRPLFKLKIGATEYNHVVELTPPSGQGRFIYLRYSATTFVLDGWWMPILLLQYPLMKFSGVSAYYTE